MDLEFAIAGGAAIAFLTNSRRSTKDVDFVPIASGTAELLRRLSAVVAEEESLPEDWLNDGVKGFLKGFAPGPVVLEAPGIKVLTIAPVQLLAMKLTAWRDDIDIEDASRLLAFCEGSKEEVWSSVERFLLPGRELKAQLAFDDLWELHR